MTPEQRDAALQIALALLPLQMPFKVALGRAVTAIFGPELTAPEMKKALDWLEHDSAIRAALARADAKGNGQ